VPERVAVVVPVRDGAAHLGAALDSVLAQRGVELDVVVVDDASRDASAEVAGRFADRGVRVESLGDPGDPRPVRTGTARSVGAARARGDWVAFLDADDLWPTDRLRRGLEAFAADPALGMCFGHAEVFRGTQTLEVVPGWLAGTMLVPRAVWERVGPMADFRAGELADWLLRARHAGVRETMLDAVLLRRRVHDANHTRGAEHLQDYTRVLKAALDRRRGRVA
jgi:glycosyltransferase involved in cell wall biosynthesis